MSRSCWYRPSCVPIRSGRSRLQEPAHHRPPLRPRVRRRVAREPQVERHHVQVVARLRLGRGRGEQRAQQGDDAEPQPPPGSRSVRYGHGASRLACARGTLADAARAACERVVTSLEGMERRPAGPGGAGAGGRQRVLRDRRVRGGHRAPRGSPPCAEGRPGARTALRLMDDPVRVISTVQVGITAIGILTGAVGEELVSDLLGGGLPDWLSFVHRVLGRHVPLGRVRRARAEGAHARPRRAAGGGRRAAGRPDRAGAAARRVGAGGLRPVASAPVRGARGGRRRGRPQRRPSCARWSARPRTRG